MRQAMHTETAALRRHLHTLAAVLGDRPDVVAALYGVAGDAFELGQLTRGDDMIDGTTTDNPFRPVPAVGGHDGR